MSALLLLGYSWEVHHILVYSGQLIQHILAVSESITNRSILVYWLKSIGALEMKFVAPMPEQIATTTMRFLKVTGELC